MDKNMDILSIIYIEYKYIARYVEFWLNFTE